jgi:hypothetical protein
VVQSVGAEDCGPNTLNVTVPVGDAPPESAADTDEASTFDPALPGDGALNEPNDGEAAPTTVSTIPAPQAEEADALLESPS